MKIVFANIMICWKDNICIDDDDYLNNVHLPADVILATDEVAGKENHRLQFSNQLLLELGSF